MRMSRSALQKLKCQIGQVIGCLHPLKANIRPAEVSLSQHWNYSRTTLQPRLPGKVGDFPKGPYNQSLPVVMEAHVTSLEDPQQWMNGLYVQTVSEIRHFSFELVRCTFTNYHSLTIFLAPLENLYTLTIKWNLKGLNSPGPHLISSVCEVLFKTSWSHMVKLSCYCSSTTDHIIYPQLVILLHL